MFIGTWLFTFHSSVGAQCVSTSHFAPELGLVGDRYSYKHSAPTELTAFGCDHSVRRTAWASAPARHRPQLLWGVNRLTIKLLTTGPGNCDHSGKLLHWLPFLYSSNESERVVMRAPHNNSAPCRGCTRRCCRTRCLKTCCCSPRRRSIRKIILSIGNSQWCRQWSAVSGHAGL